MQDSISNEKQVCHFFREHVHFGLFEGGLGTSVLRTQKKRYFFGRRPVDILIENHHSDGGSYKMSLKTLC